VSAVIDMAGKRFGKLLVLDRAPVAGKAHWQCVCDCGARTVVAGPNLRFGHTKSCGCIRSDKAVKHGQARRSKRAPEFSVWAGMLSRCRNPNNKSYPNYGGRGITVCARWHDFANFLTDMGSRPSAAHTIERVNNSLGYGPDNCVWATRDVQANNQRPRRRAQACRQGHPLDEENTFTRSDGRRGCCICRRERMRRYYARQGASA